MERKPSSLRMLEALFECEQPPVESLAKRSQEKAQHVARHSRWNTKGRSPEVSTRDAQDVAQ